MAATPETYTRTIRTMSEILDVLRDQPDPDGTLARLADRIAVEREWVRMLVDLGEEPQRPPSWIGRPVAAPAVPHPDDALRAPRVPRALRPGEARSAARDRAARQVARRW